MKKTDKLSKQQVLKIPQLLKKKSVREIAELYNVSWQAVWYWVGQLRKKGVKIITRKRGQTSLLDKQKLLT